MAHRGNDISAWDPNPFTHAPNANVQNTQTMTSPQAEAARAKSQAVMAALKRGDPGEADRLMGKQETYDSLVPGIAKLKNKFLGNKDKDKA
ncbi:hypothetical protein E4T50_11651 [Aureobasidium sp. EXF-12298]|nr:hypothetical protein E4T50_11651 [Aureobasidium sp. EXF-12298]KAI4760428.1 hypothetical protein E4T51_06561 [Aureobasidium sp. EXF-12344]KAI4772371.1 hypothetical protein E4T52_12652 [Aureobasidium sp. EXF-3400]